MSERPHQRSSSAAAAESDGTTTQPLTNPVDFAFLKAQTDNDVDLERELLELFIAQSRKVVPVLPKLAAREQANRAHLLRGSAKAIGAWPAALAAERYENAASEERDQVFADLNMAFAAAEQAIAEHLNAKT